MLTLNQLVAYLDKLTEAKSDGVTTLADDAALARYMRDYHVNI